MLSSMFFLLKSPGLVTAAQVKEATLVAAIRSKRVSDV